VYDQLDFPLTVSRAVLVRYAASLLDQLNGRDGDPTKDQETAYD